MPDLIRDGELHLFGVVGDGLGYSGFNSFDVYAALAKIGRRKDITIRLNSAGGIAHEGVAIYNALKAHAGKKTVYVEAMASSAASAIAMAGDDIVMKTGAWMMIHDPAGITIGNADVHGKAIEALDTIGDSIASIYAERTGMTVEEARAVMREETWLTADQAVERKFAHRTDKAPAGEATAFDYRAFKHAPGAILNLCDERGWSNRRKDASRDDSGATETDTMTEAEKAAAAETARKEAEARAAEQAAATAKATADATARATSILALCNDAGFPAMASGLLAGTKTLDEVKAITAGWKQIGDAVASANKVNPELKADATAYITANKSPADVSTDLLAKLAEKQATNVSGQHAGATGKGKEGEGVVIAGTTIKDATASWDPVLKRTYGDKLAA